MAGDKVMLKYFYLSDDWSANAINHCFNYLTAITGIRFSGNSESPEIFRDRGTESGTLKLKLDKYQQSDSIAGDALILYHDPINLLLQKLSAKISRGPFAEHKNLHDKPTSGSSISQIINLFINDLKKAGLIPEYYKSLAIWPEKSKFGVSVTHDVDIIRRSVAGSLKLMFKQNINGKFQGLADSIRSAIGDAPNPYGRIGEWIRLEKELNIRSTYFIFAGERLFQNDPKYPLPWLSDSISMLKDSGFEIALHNSAGGFNGNGIEKAKLLLAEFAGTEIWGIRPHYLSFNSVNYWDKIHGLGFKYSSCLGFDDDIGYIDGIDLPMMPFDTNRDRPLGIIEIPLAIMDCGLIGQNLSAIEIVERGVQLIDSTAAQNGLVVFDWHQRSLYEPEFPGWKDVFLKLIDHCRKNGGAIMTMREIADKIEANLNY